MTLNRALHQSKHFICFTDVNNFDSYDAFAQNVTNIVGDKGLNVLINNAGIKKGQKNFLSEYNVKDMTDTFTTNYIAPIMLMKVNLCSF